MKAIKMIGLVALMAMAFVGASSAMAESTSLCTVDEKDCAPGNLVESVHEGSVGKAKLLTSLGTTECNVLYLGEVLKTGSPLVIEGNFTYTECKLGSTNCTATEENGPSELKVLKEGHEQAAVTGEGLVHLVCGSSIDCSYNGTGLKGTVKGPLLSTQKNGEVSLSEQSVAKEVGGFLCPKTAKLDITTTPLAATYVSAVALRFLLLDPGKTFAEEKITEESFSGNLESELFRFVIPGEAYEVYCRGVSIAGTIYPSVLHANVSFENCHTSYIEIVVSHYYDLDKTKPFLCSVVDQSFQTKLKAVPVLHEGSTFLLWEALEKGKPFAVVPYEGGACPWAKAEFTGTVVSKLLQLNEPEQLFTFDGWTTLLFQGKGLPGDKLTHNGESETFVEGDLHKLILTGAFAGEPWGAH